jgi:hypothetical protein
VVSLGTLIPDNRARLRKLHSTKLERPRAMTLNDELEVIDETIAELEGRRIEIIHKMETLNVEIPSNFQGNLLGFPKSSIVVSKYSKKGDVW